MAKVKKIRTDLVSIPLPADVFDGASGHIKRRARIALYRLDAIATAGKSAAMYEQIAYLVPRWEGVPHVETGEYLADPEDDPNVLGMLDVDQLKWISDMLQAGKAALANGSNGQNDQT